jgi:DNA mismatch repair protein MutL
MIGKEAYPLYVLFIDLDPSQIDINVHPTKQEIKFEDEKIVYAFVQAAVKHALAQFSITPTLDFDLDPGIQQLDSISKPFTEERKAAAASSSLYQTFTQKNQAHKIESRSELKHWRDLYQIAEHTSSQNDQLLEYEKGAAQSTQQNLHTEQRHTTQQAFEINTSFNPVQLLNTYILTQTNRSFLLIHQQSAHERILYDRFVAAGLGKAIATQQSLFPSTLPLSSQDAVLLSELLSDLNQLGYLIEPFGNNNFIIQGTPADVEQGNEKAAIESLLEQYKHFTSEVKFSKREKLIRSLAWQQAVKPGQVLSTKEMESLITALFSSTQPNITPNGNPTYMEFKEDYLDKLFGK